MRTQRAELGGHRVILRLAQRADEIGELGELHETAAVGMIIVSEYDCRVGCPCVGNSRREEESREYALGLSRQSVTRLPSRS